MHFISPRDLKAKYPLSDALQKHVALQRARIVQCLKGEDRRLMLILGPCSLHNKKSALEYAQRLQGLQDQIKEQALIVMRAYFEKPRTVLGWKGALYDPHLSGNENVAEGLAWTRSLLLDLLSFSLPLATEFLEPLAAPYMEDLIALGFIGSRTTTSQTHRQLASALKLPVAFKNAPDGTFLSAIQAMEAAAAPHTRMEIDEEGRVCASKTEGNPNTCLVLRGADKGENYTPDVVQRATLALQERSLNRRLIIDCAHGNAQKRPSGQQEVFRKCVEAISSGQTALCGLMLESHLEEGSQRAIPGASPTLSITDPCLGWEATEQLVLESLAQAEEGRAVPRW